MAEILPITHQTTVLPTIGEMATVEGVRSLAKQIYHLDIDALNRNLSSEFSCLFRKKTEHSCNKDSSACASGIISFFSLIPSIIFFATSKASPFHILAPLGLTTLPLYYSLMYSSKAQKAEREMKLTDQESYSLALELINKNASRFASPLKQDYFKDYWNTISFADQLANNSRRFPDEAFTTSPFGTPIVGYEEVQNSLGNRVSPLNIDELTRNLRGELEEALTQYKEGERKVDLVKTLSICFGHMTTLAICISAICLYNGRFTFAFYQYVLTRTFATHILGMLAFGYLSSRVNQRANQLVDLISAKDPRKYERDLETINKHASPLTIPFNPEHFRDPVKAKKFANLCKRELKTLQ